MPRRLLPTVLSLLTVLLAVIAVTGAGTTQTPASVEPATVEVAALVPTADTSWRVERARVPIAQVSDWIEDRERDGGVAAQPGRVRALGTDPLLSRQWGYGRLASDRTGPAGDFGAGVVVAVIDTGVDASHPDLSGQVLAGKDFVATGTGRTDPNGHGTHVAGVIAATAGNDEGIAGIASGARILPVRVLDETGWGDDAQVAEGIVWAVEHDADVINLSLGTPDPNPLLRTAVEFAAERGVLVVAAAGNDGSQGPASYPAAWDSVLAVAATTSMDTVASFSTAGDYVDVAAPGSLIFSTVPGGYAAMSGTSMATPHVAAAAALLMASGETAKQARDRLVRSAIDLTPDGVDPRTGHGLIDPARALGLDPIDPPGSGPSLPPLPAPSVPVLDPPQLPALPPRPELPALPDPALPQPGLPQPGWPGDGRPALPEPSPVDDETGVRVVSATRSVVTGQRWSIVVEVTGEALTARLQCRDGWFRLERVTGQRVTFRPLADRTHRSCRVFYGRAASAPFTLTARPR